VLGEMRGPGLGPECALGKDPGKRSRWKGDCAGLRALRALLWYWTSAWSLTWLFRPAACVSIQPHSHLLKPNLRSPDDSVQTGEAMDFTLRAGGSHARGGGREGGKRGSFLL
jgi:hypothetical protein